MPLVFALLLVVARVYSCRIALSTTADVLFCIASVLHFGVRACVRACVRAACLLVCW
jgi:hypothetical protein